MANPKWGFKRLCLSCGAKFYDMQKDPIICPSCEAVFDPEAATKLKRGRNQVPDDKPKKEAKVASKSSGDLDDDSDDDDDDLDVLDVDDDDDDGVLEDTSDLDDDDVPVVGTKKDDDDL
ncbi:MULTISPECIES: FYDLN acid domain-containing protein [unclassified Hwanghaeella]|jgi:uncharacterized protein (TIGR02300 family)|uniref:FYDLN acid domain-containing protein n=1 Tax=unclassified Hwanghaeella TaxID=2605944 RepID=UPI000C3DC767|nr:TIGR02300 family protein [Rhodospirillaceae bacterium]MAO89961.1 TIGR02300 family protein [Rhodospirillales bacterium]MAO93716.1 TIGR02300 family protein [Rhodospirillales bacterium]MAX63879.1 TIGR02300 family protein [Rhodospirillaceae bacterium]MBB57313.1 TIGR02300 family protein [Rhodospirillaceae bacterium]|tara:strand:+ start:15790 stop:16146 length:357 start_codon:yes stop_codon:yes gene_type:complete